MSNKSYWIYLSSAIVLLILPVSEIARWIRVSGSVKGGQTERVAAYMAPVPAAFQDPFAHTLGLLGLCVAAVFFELFGSEFQRNDQSGKWYRLRNSYSTFSLARFFFNVDRFDLDALGKKFLTFGLIFLAAGIVTQGFTFSFESAMFNLGLIFSLSGLASLFIHRVKRSPE